MRKAMNGTVQQFAQKQLRICTHNNDFLNPKTASPFDVMVLNAPIPKTKYMDNALANASRILCADGGANRLYEYNPTYATILPLA